MRLYVCETCGTHDLDATNHVGHRVMALEGDDMEELVRVAANHLVLAQRITNSDLREFRP